MLELYHGSNQVIKQIDLTKCKPFKDFGKGFYLTDILQQAKDMAYKRVRVAGGCPAVTKYLFDESLLGDGCLNVLSFDKPSEEWAKFILANRHRGGQKYEHEYDVVIGPIADDGVAFQLQKYEDGGMTLEQLAKELTFKKLNRQYFFGTEKAIVCLQLQGSIALSE